MKSSTNFELVFELNLFNEENDNLDIPLFLAILLKDNIKNEFYYNSGDVLVCL